MQKNLTRLALIVALLLPAATAGAQVAAPAPAPLTRADQQRPDQPQLNQHRAEQNRANFAAQLAKELGLSTAKVQAALDALRPQRPTQNPTPAQTPKPEQPGKQGQPPPP